MKYKAVLWDWDGTLFNSDRQVWWADNLALAQHGFPTRTYEVFRNREGNGIVQAVGYSVPESKVNEVRKTFLEHFDTSQCELIEGASDVLRYLKNLSVPSSIVSAHPVDEVLATVRRIGIEHCFRHVIGGMHDKRNALLNVCKLLGVEPYEAFFVGDLLSDIRDGNAAGLHTVLYAPLDYPYLSHATHHITHLKDVIRLLEEP